MTVARCFRVPCSSPISEGSMRERRLRPCGGALLLSPKDGWRARARSYVLA